MSFIKYLKPLLGITLTCAAIYFVVFTQFDVVSEGEGVLAINDSNVNILSPSSGTITKILVTSGDDVEKNQQLLTINNIEDENKKTLLDFNLSFYSDQVTKLTQELITLKKIIQDGKPHGELKPVDSTKLLLVMNKYNTYLQKEQELKNKNLSIQDKVQSLEGQQTILKDKSQMIQKSLGNTVRLLDSKLESEKIKFQTLESALTLEEAKSISQTAYLDFIQLVLEQTEQTETDLKKNREFIAQTKSELDTVTQRIQSTDIVSTVNGTVLSLQEGLSEGVYIERNSDIMTLKREDDGVFVDAKFDSKFRPYLGIGEMAKMKINAPGIKDYFVGTIAGISVDSFNYEEYSKKEGRYYKVKVAFDSAKAETKKLKQLLGIKTTVYVVNDTMTFLEYVLSTFNKDLDFTVW